MSARNYKVVFIDWNGTLSDSKFWWHLENIKHPRNYMFQKLEQSLFGNLRELVKPWMRGELKSEDVIKKVAKDSKLNYKYILNEFIDSCRTMQISKDLSRHITNLKDLGVKVVIATDNMDSFTRWTVPALNLNYYFDEIITSPEVKALKQDFDESGNSLFFKEFNKKNSIDPVESILIDDSEDKDNRLKNYGINYFRIKNSSELIPTLSNIVMQ